MSVRGSGIFSKEDLLYCRCLMSYFPGNCLLTNMFVTSLKNEGDASYMVKGVRGCILTQSMSFYSTNPVKFYCQYNTKQWMRTTVTSQKYTGKLIKTKMI